MKVLMEIQAQVIIRPSKLPAILGISMATINRLRAAGNFVTPIRLGVQAIGFRRSDIDAWLDSRPPVYNLSEAA